MSKVQAPEAPAAPAAGEESPPAKRKTPLLLYAAVGVVLLGLLGAGGWFLVPRFLGAGKTGHAEAKPEEAVKATVPLGAVIVNIAGTEARRYLKVGVELGVPGPKDVKAVEEWKPQLLDLLITVLSATPLEALSTGEGRAELKRALLARIRNDLGLKKVSQVYFTEFVIQ